MIATFSFIGGTEGAWRVRGMQAVAGAPLPFVEAIAIRQEGSLPAQTGYDGSAWTLRGVASHARYATADEMVRLRARQAPLGRTEARFAALIPIRKSSAWWSLAQDERRAIFEESSAHTAIGLDYLPAIARRLHHSRDLGEPFDFLTWFDYAPHDEPAFEKLVERLRGTPEWAYVDREVDIRLERET